MGLRPGQLQKLAVALAPFARHRDFLLPVQILRRQAVLARQHVRHRSRRDDAAAELARARPHIDQKVCRADGVFVVLDHNHRIADVAQPVQRLQQPVIVALVQPD